MKFWFYIAKELSDLESDFQRIFEVNNLYRDYENVWEWIESIDRKSKVYLNISRQHNWEKGEYDKPIILIIESNNVSRLNEAEIAFKIKKEFNCPVYAGEINIDQNDNPIIGVNREY